jgi:hypothetical protein
MVARWFCGRIVKVVVTGLDDDEVDGNTTTGFLIGAGPRDDTEPLRRCARVCG